MCSLVGPRKTVSRREMAVICSNHSLARLLLLAWATGRFVLTCTLASNHMLHTM